MGMDRESSTPRRARLIWQSIVLEAEQHNADSTTTISTTLVQLHEALGGGWETSFPCGSAAERALKGVGFPLVVAAARQKALLL